MVDQGMNAAFPRHRMSAFGGKADMTFCGTSVFAVAIGGKADMAFCSRTCLLLTQSGHWGRKVLAFKPVHKAWSLRGAHAPARVHQFTRQRCSDLAVRSARTEVDRACGGISWYYGRHMSLRIAWLRSAKG